LHKHLMLLRKENRELIDKMYRMEQSMWGVREGFPRIWNIYWKGELDDKIWGFR
jgi:hypothetical protein